MRLHNIRTILFTIMILVFVTMVFQQFNQPVELPPEDAVQIVSIQPAEENILFASIGTAESIGGGIIAFMLIGMTTSGLTNKATPTWLAFIAAVVALALGIMDIVSYELALSLIGVLGFGGLAGLRTFIDSSGSKTFIVAALGVMGVAGFAFGVITPDQLQIWLAAFGILSGATLTHAALKAA